jgi:PPOX class probable F420-dependent enzyme
VKETVMTLDDAAIQRFLATKEIAILATIQPDGSPLAMPMWFLHDPTTLTMISVAGLQKVKNLERDPRVYVVAESSDGGIRGVGVAGRADFLSDSADRRSLVERFLKKYTPRLQTLWSGTSMPPNRVMFRITPSKVRSWGLS